jgi:hypothetical protein
MKKHRRRAIVAARAAAAATALITVSTPAAHADVPAPYFATSNNASDPHIIPCAHPSSSVNGFCLYTSRDMGQSFAYTGNPYPMEETRVFFSPNGVTGWVDQGQAFHENTIEVANGGWVPNNAFHLWAPAAVKSGSFYYLYVPDVSNKNNTGNPNIHTSSRIAVARSTSPFGPFTYQGTVTVHGYMSDPDVVIDGSQRYLIWADGDHGNCGGLSSAQLQSDMRSTVSGTVKQLVINGVNVLGNCGGKGRPYLEGGSLYKVNGQWRLFFAAKPTSTPNECKSEFGGSNTANEVIAWATASNPQGPYTYRGIVICGSTTEWTNQATIMTTPGNKQVIVYHDSPANVKQRKLHAECLYSNPHGTPIIAGVYRQALNASYGFNDCINGVKFDYYGWHMVDPQYPNHPPIITATSGGSGDLMANRYAVGPWERYQIVSLGSGNVAIRSLANEKFLCTPNRDTPIKASCDSPTGTAVWRLDTVGTPGTGKHRLFSVQHGRYLSVAGNKKLYASGTDTGSAAVLTVLYPGP